jgi:hypothetical protein
MNAVSIVVIAFIAVIGSLINGDQTAIMITTSMLVLITIAISSIISAKIFIKIARKIDVKIRK